MMIEFPLAPQGRYFTLDAANILDWIKPEAALAIWSDADDSLRLPDHIPEVMRLMYEVKYLGGEN